MGRPPAKLFVSIINNLVPEFSTVPISKNVINPQLRQKLRFNAELNNDELHNDGVNFMGTTIFKCFLAGSLLPVFFRGGVILRKRAKVRAVRLQLL